MAETLASDSAPAGSFNADLRGVHYDFLKDRIPAWFSQATAQRQQELADHPLHLPAWYASAGPALVARHTHWRETLNTLDAQLGALEDPAAFAEPKLRAAIKQQFNLDLDVRRVYFARKYAFKNRNDLYGFFSFEHTHDTTLDYRYRGQSLLEAAMANFAPGEEQPAACDDCQILTTWGSYDDEVTPTFAELADHAVAIAPHAFARLCRTLDLGAQYQAHIKARLTPDDKAAREALEQQLEQHHRAQLALSLELERVHSPNLSAAARTLLERLLADQAPLALQGRPVTVAAVKLFGAVLVGPLLIGPARQGSDRPEPLVVYLPNDPEQPLKEYTSSGEFMADLRARLHSVEYRRFFSGYIAVREQGAVFQYFNRLYQPAGGAATVDFPLASNLARLPLDEVAITGNLWTQLRQAQVRKAFADARSVVVPTGDEDRQARLERLQSYAAAVVGLLNLGAFVVPGLGPLMLTLGAAQLTDEAFEGIEAYEQGELTEMWAHFASVALNVAAVGTGAKVLPQVRLSSLVDGLQPVTLDSGAQKLWRRDLEPYRASVTLPEGARPNALGLYADDGYSVLSLDGQHYRVRQDPATGEYRIRHPSRAGAYGPRLAHNGQGAWRHELEQPQTWHGPRLMRRLGPVVEGFSDAELEQIRHVSGVDEDLLRRLHADSGATPTILLDTVRQFRAYASAVEVAEGIGADALPDALCGYAATLAVELPGWPADHAIEAFTGPGLSGASVKYGSADALPVNTLQVDRAELMSGKLPERITDFLGETRMDQLVGRYTARDRAARIGAVKSRLQARALLVRARLMRSAYADQQPVTDAAEALVQRDFQHLPTLMVREMLDALMPLQRTALNRASRLPLDLAQKARLLQQQARLAHAYEGLYLEALANPDTEALVLNTLQRLPGWSDDLRLEVREGELQGTLRASFGAVDASERKVLVRVGDGRYEARNVRDEHLHGSDDLYGAIQHALPDRHRQALELGHVAQGAQLKQAIIAHALP
ncbi:dermonecrotic toxin domain-containing protein, partial [Pseudomonas sp. DWR1-3-2b2]